MANLDLSRLVTIDIDIGRSTREDVFYVEVVSGKYPVYHPHTAGELDDRLRQAWPICATCHHPVEEFTAGIEEQTLICHAICHDEVETTTMPLLTWFNGSTIYPGVAFDEIQSAITDAGEEGDCPVAEALATRRHDLDDRTKG